TGLLLLQTVTGRGLAAVGAVQPKLAFKFRHMCHQCGVLGEKCRVLGPQFGDERLIPGHTRRVVLRRVNVHGRCHRHLDSRRPVAGQPLFRCPYLGSYTIRRDGGHGFSVPWLPPSTLCSCSASVEAAVTGVGWTGSWLPREGERPGRAAPRPE